MSPPDHNSLECLIQVPDIGTVPYPAALSPEGLSLGGHCGSPLSNQPSVSQRGRGTSSGTSHSCAHRLWLFPAAKQTDPASN